MRVLLQLALCGMLAGSGALAQRGGGGHGGGGGGFRGGGGMGGGFRGGGMGGGFRGGGMGGGFRGGFGGGGFRGGGFRGGFNNFKGGRFNNFRFNNFGRFGRFNNGFGGGFWPGWGWGWGGLGWGDWGWPDSSWYCDSYLGCGDGGYGYGGGAAASYYNPSPNVTVIAPPAQPQAYPVYVERANPVTHEYDQYGQETTGGASAVSNGPPIYLIAMKDHVIRAAAAYWVEGANLHYVTLQHEGKQVPLDSVDRPLSIQLNRERRVQFVLPTQ
jgi:hypothetical protein